MDPSHFTVERAQEAAAALDNILRKRTHARKVLGQTMIFPGRLGEALRLPQIKNALNSKMSHRREVGLDQFRNLWPTLSEPTKRAVLDRMGWYEVDAMDWEDKRSNRRPLV
ncbi:hypothetical protein [Allohahella marinimesophila]|uniref:Uncharacterized protein n=1 Tax=Allohahella marinimesophila TaxID=1054972 RepID=A0ABP7Q0I1_9GAMM